jgi:hypothetical protein
MKPAGPGPSAARRLALAAAAAVALAYQVQRPVTMPSTGLLSAASLDGFYPGEGNFRWSRGRGRIVFRDPGPGVAARVEVDLAGWRPRGQEPPRVVVEAEGARVEAQPARLGQTVTLPIVTRGWWRSDVEVRLQSETFRPGPQDPRPLGVRVHAARLVPDGPVLWPRRPPLGAPLMAALTVLLVLGALSRLGVSPARVRGLGLGLVLAAGLAHAFARPYAAWLALPALVAAALLALVARAAPAAARLTA